jgi:hypothetical protein
MIFIAMIIGHICGSIAESRGRSRKVWFWRCTIFSFMVIWGWHQKHEYQKIKSMNMSLGDIIRIRLTDRKQRRRL